MPIIEGEVSRIPGIWDDPALVERRHKFLEERMASQYHVVNRRNADSDQRTCILDGLQFVDGLFRLPQFASTPKLLAIVSDMIEECQVTPLGTAINLNKPVIDEYLRQAENHPEGSDWSQVRVCVVLPANPEPSGRGRRRPRQADLRTFWTRIFGRYRVPASRISWAVGMIPRDSTYQSSMR